MADTEFELGQSIPVTQSQPTWNGGMVAVSIIVALFTCGLGLILLFLSRSTQVYTTVTDTVTVKAPTFQFVAQGNGGAQFVAWTQTWRHQLALHAEEVPAPPATPAIAAPPPTDAPTHFDTQVIPGSDPASQPTEIIAPKPPTTDDA